MARFFKALLASFRFFADSVELEMGQAELAGDKAKQVDEI